MTQNSSHTSRYQITGFHKVICLKVTYPKVIYLKVMYLKVMYRKITCLKVNNPATPTSVKQNSHWT